MSCPKPILNPCDYLINPSLSYSSDNVPTMLLMSWGLDCQMFEGDSVAGPIPTLFGEDIIASKSAISANPERAFSDFQRLVRAFFMPETLQPEEAPNFVKKPRSVPFLFSPYFCLSS